MRGLTSATGASNELVTGITAGFNGLRAATARDACGRARSIFAPRLFVAGAGLAGDQSREPRGAERQ